VVGIAHRECRFWSDLPSRGRSCAALLFVDADVPKVEARPGGFSDDPDRVTLIGGPASEVEYHRGAALQDLMGNPEHASFEDVPATVRVAVVEEWAIHSSGVSRRIPTSSAIRRASVVLPAPGSPTVRYNTTDSVTTRCSQPDHRPGKRLFLHTHRRGSALSAA